MGFKEVSLSALDPSSSDALALSQRLAARQPGTDTWRGFSVSSPFLPGALQFGTAQHCLQCMPARERCKLVHTWHSPGFWALYKTQKLATVAEQRLCAAASQGAGLAAFLENAGMWGFLAPIRFQVQSRHLVRLYAVTRLVLAHITLTLPHPGCRPATTCH